MKKKKLKIIGLVVTVIIIVGLLIFACTYKFADSHLRKEGIRVRLESDVLIADGCDEESMNLTYCKRNISVNGKDAYLEFELININENGYPTTLVVSVNGHELYRIDDLDYEMNLYAGYQVFLNFEAVGDYIAFTHTNGVYGRSTTLYVVDTDGNIILQEYEIDENDMLLKDYTDFITYDDNVITVYASRLLGEYINEGSVCDLDKKEIVEAYYTYTYKDGKFTKKQTKTITAEDYIADADNEVTCE